MTGVALTAWALAVLCGASYLLIGHYLHAAQRAQLFGVRGPYLRRLRLAVALWCAIFVCSALSAYLLAVNAAAGVQASAPTPSSCVCIR